MSDDPTPERHGLAPHPLLWPAITVLISLMTLTGGLYLGALIFGSPEVIAGLVNGRVISRGLVLFMIVPSLVLLCLQDKVSGEATIAALSATGGYVLGEAQGGP